MTLDNRVAVVTGATRGVGRGVARALAAEGARVFVTGRSADDAELANDGIELIRCDHRDDAQVNAAFARILGDGGEIDILVNNVWGGYERMVDGGAFTWGKPFWEQPLWRWDAMMRAGVRAGYVASHHAARLMVSSNTGLPQFPVFSRETWQRDLVRAEFPVRADGTPSNPNHFWNVRS